MLDADKIKSYFTEPVFDDNYDLDSKYEILSNPDLFDDFDFNSKAEAACYSVIIDEPVRIKVTIDSKKILQILRRMRLLLYNSVCNVKSRAFSLHNRISFIFGLCACRSSFIFHSFFGSSLSRIPSYL